MNYEEKSKEELISEIQKMELENKKYKELIEHAPVAAEEATAVASNREAYGFYRTLIPYYQQIAAPRRAEILEAWSYIASVVNDLPESVKLSNEAIIIREELGDPIRLGNALRWRSRVTWLSGDRDAAESAADEAVAVLEPHGASPELAYAYSTQAQLDMLAWRNNEAVERAELAIRVAEEVGDIRVLAHATVNLGTALTVLSYPANTDVLQRGIDLAAEIGFNDEVARGRVNLIWSALLHRDLRTAEQWATSWCLTARRPTRLCFISTRYTRWLLSC